MRVVDEKKQKLRENCYYGFRVGLSVTAKLIYKNLEMSFWTISFNPIITVETEQKKM